jgi:hypothetical protein
MDIYTRIRKGRAGQALTRQAVLVAACCCLIACGSGESAAQSDEKSTLADQKSVAITIYNSNLGLVKDVRDLSLRRGLVSLRFEGVAAMIDPTSVHIRSLSNPGELAVLEQNFEYDLISPEKLLEKYLGRDVELVHMNKDGEEVRRDARLLGNRGGYVYEMDGKIAINPGGRVEMPELPEGLISRPTLMWLLENRRSTQRVEASYLTSGINWHANYVVVLADDEQSIDLSGWVTIMNQSGATYENATVKLVAGDVNRVSPEGVVQPLATRTRVVYEEAKQFQEQAFFEYHLYTLQRPTTVKDNQTKQIALLDSEGAAVTKQYVYEPRASYWFAAMKAPMRSSKVEVRLSFSNSKENQLGMPLPRGVVRVYKRDPDDALQFIGEDRIDHTPEDEDIRIRMGDAFDVVAERAQTDYRVLESGKLYESAYRVEIRNHKDDDITVQVMEVIPGDWEITSSSHKFEKETSNRVRFALPVKAKGETELTYRVRIRQ